MATEKKPGKPGPTRAAARKSSATTKAAAGVKPAAGVKKRAKPAEELAKPTARKLAAGKSSAKGPAAQLGPATADGPLEAYIAAAATALSLPVEPAWLPAIKANLEVTLRLGAQVTDFELRDEAEPAPVFGA